MRHEARHLLRARPRGQQHAPAAQVAGWAVRAAGAAGWETGRAGWAPHTGRGPLAPDLGLHARLGCCVPRRALCTQAHNPIELVLTPLLAPDGPGPRCELDPTPPRRHPPPALQTEAPPAPHAGLGLGSASGFAGRGRVWLRRACSLTPESSWQVPRPSFQTPARRGRVCIPALSPAPPRARRLASEPSHTLRGERPGSAGLLNPQHFPPNSDLPCSVDIQGSCPLTWQGDGAVLIHRLPGAGLGPPGLRGKGRPRL